MMLTSSLVIRLPQILLVSESHPRQVKEDLGLCIPTQYLVYFCAYEAENSCPCRVSKLR